MKMLRKIVIALLGCVALFATTSVNAQKLPYDPAMTAIDGTVHHLSDFKGKILYIDIWATWCGPCCAEIPYLEKMVEYFKNNKKIQFISISVDTNKEAWVKKIESDKPVWKQFILSKEEQKKFLSAWGIKGIPRFILIGKNGDVLNADSIRPSDKTFISYIEGSL